jgi:hypothetical protein
MLHSFRLQTRFFPRPVKPRAFCYVQVVAEAATYKDSKQPQRPAV